MVNLKIIKATYYVPKIGLEEGAHVTDELSAQIMDDKLFYDGIYNRIFPDNFCGKVKKLRVDIKYRKKRFIKIYNENEKINLPYDLGEISKERTPRNPNINVLGDYVNRDKKIRTPMSNISNKSWWKRPEIIIPIIIALLSIPWLPDVYRIVKQSVPIISDAESTATTTPNLIDIYKRAFSYEILADRQDFFKRYVNSNIYGDGTVKEISRLDDRYIVDIDIGSYSVLCPQEKTDDFERLYPLLLNRSVRFYGIFTYSTYFSYDNNKVVIDQCSFERK